MPPKKLAPLAPLALLALLLALHLRTLALDARVAAEQDAVIEELLEGNEAFAHGVTISRSQISADLRRSTDLSSQKPKAIVLSCADSRVPVEHVFRQGVGDLFVVRLAGNVPMKLGGTIASVEYALEHIGTPKVLVVLGHAKCGAVKSTIEVREGARALLADAGFNPVYGARPLQRVIQSRLRDPLAGVGEEADDPAAENDDVVGPENRRKFYGAAGG